MLCCMSGCVVLLCYLRPSSSQIFILSVNLSCGLRQIWLSQYWLEVVNFCCCCLYSLIAHLLHSQKHCLWNAFYTIQHKNKTASPAHSDIKHFHSSLECSSQKARWCIYLLLFTVALVMCRCSLAYKQIVSLKASPLHSPTPSLWIHYFSTTDRWWGGKDRTSISQISWITGLS